MTTYDLAAWAFSAYATYDLASTHRIVAAATGPGPLPDHVSARVDPFTGTVLVPRPVGVVLARVVPDAAGRTAPVDDVVRRVLSTRNALLVEAVPPASTAADGDLATDGWQAALARRVRALAALAVGAGAPEGVLQLAGGAGTPDVVLAATHDAPVVVIVLDGSTVEHDGHVIAGLPLDQALRVARGALRETGGDRVRVYSADPAVPVRVAAALPVTRVAVNDGPMPPAAPDGLLTWTRIGVDAVTVQPWTAPTGPVPAYPRASHEAP